MFKFKVGEVDPLFYFLYGISNMSTLSGAVQNTRDSRRKPALIYMEEELKKIILPILEEEKIELVELIYRKEAGRQVLRLLVDREGGVMLLDCVRLNEKISSVLDEANVIPETYTLEVDSPGVDRPLKTKRDYERSIERLVRVTLNEQILCKKEYIGRLKQVGETSIKIETQKKGVLEIAFDKIIRARQEVEF